MMGCYWTLKGAATVDAPGRCRRLSPGQHDRGAQIHSASSCLIAALGLAPTMLFTG